MLTKADEYPYHQTAQTFASVASADQAWNDGHYVCLCDMDGNIGLVSNVRLYQNNDVLDGFVCIRHEGRQHNIRLSRRLRPDMDTLAVGPLRLEILEPMRTVRLVLEENDYGMKCDLVCRSTALPYEDPMHVTQVDHRPPQERLTYELVGTCEGSITVAGTRFEVTPEKWFLFRNHSWGAMGMRGGPRAHWAPARNPTPPMVGLRNWVLYRMPNEAGFYQLFEDPSGKRLSSDGAMLHEDRIVPVTKIEHDLQFYEDTIRLKSGTFSLTDAEGQRRTYEIEDLGWVYCQGGGYFGGFDDGLGQGVYRGEYHVEGEVWDTSHPTRVVQADGSVREFHGAWAENFTRLTRDDQVGLAHFECVVFRS
jgi:hypothetical protein